MELIYKCIIWYLFTLIFGITLSLFNCKIIKIINKYLLLQYITLLLSIFFLFIIIEPENSKKHLIYYF